MAFWDNGGSGTVNTYILAYERNLPGSNNVKEKARSHSEPDLSFSVPITPVLKGCHIARQ
jgi:hypothetical protein